MINISQLIEVVNGVVESAAVSVLEEVTRRLAEQDSAGRNLERIDARRFPCASFDLGAQ